MGQKIFIFFQLHQHFKINNFRVYDISHNENYFNEELLSETLNGLEENSYLPMLNLIEKLALENENKVHFIFSVSGVALEYMMKNDILVIEKLKKLVDLGVIDFTSETYYDSLSSIRDLKEFKREIIKHNRLLFSLFKIEPKIFKNTNLIYSDKLFEVLDELNISKIMSPDLSRFEIANPNFFYSNYNSTSLVLSMNYKFSRTNFKKINFDSNFFLNSILFDFKKNNSKIVNLFFDIERFGVFNKKESGIFDFFEKFILNIISSENLSLGKIDDLDLIDLKELKRLNVDDYIFKSDYRLKEKNELQISALSEYYDLGKLIKKFLNFKIKEKTITKDDEKLIIDWGKLSSYQHFLYMDSSKNWPDLDIHRLFNNLKNPYDYYISYMNILADIRFRLEKKREKLRFERSIINKNSISKSGILMSVKQETKA